MTQQEHLTRNEEVFGAEGPYDEHDFFRWQQQKLETIGSVLSRLPRKDQVADIGCYTGLAANLYRNYGAGSIDGFDLSESALTFAARRGLRTFHWNCDGEVCPAPSLHYDVIIAADIIEHLVNTDRFVQELHRISKPEGYLILTTPNLASWRNRLRLVRGLPPTSYPGTSSTVARDFWIDRNHIRVNVLSEWEALLEHHGFTIVEVLGSTYMGILEAGWKMRAMKVVDRFALRVPTLATGLVIVARPQQFSG